jgi:DNA ligase D-like protein (predicted ligase)
MFGGLQTDPRRVARPEGRRRRATGGRRKPGESPNTQAAESTKPEFVPPMLGKLVRTLPEGPGWSFEAKFDGYRIEAIKSGSEVRLQSRRDSDLTKRFASVARAVSKINATTAVLDGEVVAVDSSGQPSFQILQNRARLPAGWHLAYYAFDLLHLNGKDLRFLALKERRAALEKVLEGSGVRFSSSLDGTPDVLIEAVKEHHMEGVIAKRLDSVYESGQRSGAWRKLPLKPKGEFVIGGYRLDGAALELLLVGYYEQGKLLFAGKVRQGLNPRIRAALLKGLTPIRTPKCPFSNLPSSRSGHWGEGVTAEQMGDYVWLEPRVVAEVKFAEWTGGPVLRHAEFVAVRGDKRAGEVGRQR